MYNKFKLFEQKEVSKYIQKGEICHGKFNYRTERNRKTQQMIELANEKVKTSNGNVVFIKKSHRNTTTLDFGVRAICMEDYPDILTMDEFIGFLYGMVAGNHDIDTIFIDSVLKQADISLNNISAFMTSLSKISAENTLDFFISVGAEKESIPDIDSDNYNVLN